MVFAIINKVESARSSRNTRFLPIRPIVTNDKGLLVSIVCKISLVTIEKSVLRRANAVRRGFVKSNS